VRALLVALVAFATPAHADPLPSGALGLVTGAIAGTGADAKRIGAGWYEFGAQASWQPQTTERRWGWTLRWATLFGVLYNGSAAQIESQLRTTQLDFTAGVRYRPWVTPSRFLTGRAGVELLRANQPIPTSSMSESRSFAGPIASVGIDQYAGGFLFSVDVRYGLIVTGPGELALMFGVAVAGP
jgi:hypothetical protein